MLYISGSRGEWQLTVLARVKCLRRSTKGAQNIRASDGGAGSCLDVPEDHENLSPQEILTHIYDPSQFVYLLKKRIILEGKRMWKPLGYRKTERKS